MSLRIRRGIDSQRRTVVLDPGEIAWSIDQKKLYVGDGTTAGGVHVLATSVDETSGLMWDNTTQKIKYTGALGAALANIVEDTDPALGGNLNLNNKTINGTGTIDFTGNISATALSLTTGLTSNLPLNTHDITGTGNIDITGNLYATGTLHVAGLGSNLPLNGRNIVGGSITINGSTGAISGTTLTLGTGLGGNLNLNNRSIIGTGSISINATANLQIRQILDGVNPNGFITTTVNRGTFGSPTAVQAGDELGGLILKGYTNSSTNAIAGLISFVVDDTAVIAGGPYIKTKIILSAATDVDQHPENAFILDSSGVATVPTISVGDGNATNPSIVFSTDGGVDSGFFHPEDGVVCVSINTEEKVRVDSGGMRVNGFMKVSDVAGNLPGSPEVGMIVLDGNTFKGYTSGGWVDLN